jgi:hypothetical protein
MDPEKPTDIAQPGTIPIPIPVTIPLEWLTRWAEAALRINHLNTLVQRGIQEGRLQRSCALAERARVAAFGLHNELLTAGAASAACDPEYPYVHWHRGLACEALGQIEAARQQFDLFGQGLLVLGKAPAPDLLAAIREKLQRYRLDEIYVF